MAARARALPPQELVWLVLITVPGAFVLRSSACTINDIFDRDLDAAVGSYVGCFRVHSKLNSVRSIERTKMRPVACGAVSVPAAGTFLALQMALGAAFFMVYGSSLVYVDAWRPFINYTYFDWSTSVFQILGRNA